MKSLLAFDSQEDSFRQFILISLILHFSFLIILTVKSFLLPSRIIEIQNSVRVDMVALPDKLPDNPVPAPKAEPKAEPKSEAKPEPPKPKPQLKIKEAKPKPESLQSAKEAQKKALEKLKAMEAVEKLKDEVRSEEAAKKSAAKAAQYKGNIISSGNSFTGMSKLRVNEYYDNLINRVREHWELPQWLSNANLKAAVVITIDDRGYLTKKEIHTSSGNNVFDQNCLSAVNAAAPFDPPPSEVKEALIMIRFPFE
jgi:colicin import membrane protein